MIDYMLNGKVMVIPLKVGLIKKIYSKYMLYKMSQYNPQPYKPSNGIWKFKYII